MNSTKIYTQQQQQQHDTEIIDMAWVTVKREKYSRALSPAEHIHLSVESFYANII